MASGKKEHAIEYARLSIALYNKMNVPYPKWLDEMLPENNSPDTVQGVSTEWTQ